MSVPLTVRLWAADPPLVTSREPPAGTVSAAGASANSLSSTVADPAPAPPGVSDDPSSPANKTATVAKIKASTAITTPKATAPNVLSPSGGDVPPSATGDDRPSAIGGGEVCTGAPFCEAAVTSAVHHAAPGCLMIRGQRLAASGLWSSTPVPVANRPQR